MLNYNGAVYAVNEQNIDGIGRILPDGCVLTVGSFDGVHLGHRALLNELKKASGREGVPAVAVTFAPGDRPKSAPAIAQPEKVFRLLRDCGADLIVTVPFAMLRGMTASEFAERFIVDTFSAKRFVCGYDFRFGFGRKGDASTLKELLGPHGIGITVCEPVIRGGAPVSSTRIRALITEGDIASANELLESPFSFKGKVIKGDHIAASLGYPTANLAFPPELCVPAYGVYAAEFAFSGEKCRAMLNFGVKPTFGPAEAPLCEVNLFGFSGDIYGVEAEVSFLAFIRPEERFATPARLAERIAADRAAVERFFDER
ncbi:MAG: riboflavin biosynthesis protein RibF [Clostridia bacterium]|nr:riboflavin biosynthesis protein RibF [Clostridia bacterium]